VPGRFLLLRTEREVMHLSRRLGGLLAAGMIAAGVTAVAAPASASNPSPYFEIITGVSANGLTECLQGDFGGPLGTSVTQHYCDPTFTNTHQQWLPISLGGDGYKFENVSTGLCLEARNGAANGTPVALWDCSSGESNTRWAWDTSNGEFPFPGISQIQSRVSGSTGYCLDVPGASTAIGLQLQIYRCNNTNAQLFWITYPAS
jgi:hypothetical protein